MSDRESDEAVRDDGYPDPVLKTRCLECQQAFYVRGHAGHCPYCQSKDVVNEGSGVVCHNAE